MKGSEKQIAWANDILANINKIYAEAENFPAPENVKKALAAQKEAINAAEFAGDIIDLFGSINFNGEVPHDLPFIVSVFRVRVPSTEGQKKILMK